ncbi:MAG: CHASE2 domain-containing protein [Leptolyngbyaceae cyanobacterium]
MDRQHLENQLQEDYRLLKEVEDELRDATNPLERNRLRRQKQALERSIRDRQEQLERLPAPPPPPLPPPPKNFLYASLLISTVGAVLVTAIRLSGLLQVPELAVYDQFMRGRPDARPDDRLTLIEINDKDITAQPPDQGTGSASLSDIALSDLLEKLKSYNPRTIGLDVYRQYPVFGYSKDSSDTLKKKQKLVDHYENNKKLITICKVPDPNPPNPDDRDLEGTPPPEWFSSLKRAQPDSLPDKSFSLDRLSFSDFIKDQDGVLRRHLLKMEQNPDVECQAEFAFSLRVAAHYLRRSPDDLITQLFPWLQSHSGGYQHIDTRGVQLLLNYRKYAGSINIIPDSQKISLSTFLSKESSQASNLKKEIEGKIILIGITARQKSDNWTTPFSKKPEDTRGIYLQAQMISQILSAIEGVDGPNTEKRNTLWFLPQWLDGLLILISGLIGGLIAWYVKRPIIALIALGVAVSVLIGLYFLAFSALLWLPLFPSGLAMAIAWISVIGYTKLQTRR